MALQAGNIGDLVTTTLADLGRLKMTDIMSKYQRTIVLKRLVKKNKMTFDAGQSLQFNLITDTNGSARFVGLYAEDLVDVPNVMTTATVPWRHVTWNWAFDEHEPVMNGSPAKI